jgi:hypothetical protein
MSDAFKDAAGVISIAPYLESICGRIEEVRCSPKGTPR